MAIASSQCADVTVGLGNFYVNGDGIGYLKNNVEYSYEYDVLKFYTGSPQILTCQFVTKLNSSLKATYAQLNSSNLARSLGNLAVSNLATSTHTVASGSPEIYTPELDQATGNYWFRLGGIKADGTVLGLENGALSNINTVVVKDGSSVLDLTTDYTIDALGNVKLIAGGAYTPADNISVSYVATVLAGVNINLGNSFSLNEMDVMFVHNKLNGGKRVTIWIPRCTVTGKINLKFSETEVVLNDIQLDALQDARYPDYPMGKIFTQK